MRLDARGLALGMVCGQKYFNKIISRNAKINQSIIFVPRASLEAAREGSAESRASDLLGGRGFLGYFFCRNKKSDKGLQKVSDTFPIIITYTYLVLLKHMHETMNL